MKKIYLTAITFLTVGAVFNASAQQQPTNGDFESWNTSDFPTGWNDMTTGDLCGLCGFGSSKRIFQDTTVVFAGTSSVRVESSDAFGNVVNGTMTTGKVHAPSTTPSEGYAQTHITDANFNHPFTDIPDSLVFYAQYNQTGTTDSAAVSVILHDNSNYKEPNGNINQVIAEARLRFQTGGVGAWEKFSVPFLHVGNSTNPIAFALMTFTSSYEPGQGSSSSKLWVDEYSFVYNITPVLSTSSVDVSVFTDGLIDVDYSTGGVPLAATDFQVELSDATGSFATPVVIGSITNTLQASGTISCTIPAGTLAGAGYKVRVTNASEHYASIEVPLTVTNLTVGVADAANHNIRVFGYNGDVTIDMSNTALEHASFEIISLSGQLVATGALTAGASNTVAYVQTGVYVVRLIHSEGIIASKVWVN